MTPTRTESIPAEQAEVAYRMCRPILDRILSNAAFSAYGSDFWRTLAVSIYTQGMLDCMTLVDMGKIKGQETRAMVGALHHLVLPLAAGSEAKS